MKLYLNKVWLVLAFLAASQAFAARAAVIDGNRIMDQDMGENLCALTFDDGPSHNTPALLDMLAEYKIPATFFLLGGQVVYYPALVKRMVAEGHEVGNHSWSHPNLRRLGFKEQARQIEETDSFLRSLGATPLFMRPPYGSFDDNTIKILENLGVSLMLWSMDSRDWKRLPEDYSKLRSTRGTVYDDGALRGVFLFHDTHKNTVDDLPRIIANLKAGGCERFVTVSEYLRGITDPEPGMLMTRRPARSLIADRARKDRYLKYCAGSGPMALARCSKPFNPDVKPQNDNLPLDEAHAAVDTGTGGI